MSEVWSSWKSIWKNKHPLKQHQFVIHNSPSRYVCIIIQFLTKCFNRSSYSKSLLLSSSMKFTSSPENCSMASFICWKAIIIVPKLFPAPFFLRVANIVVSNFSKAFSTSLIVFEREKLQMRHKIPDYVVK